MALTTAQIDELKSQLLIQRQKLLGVLDDLSGGDPANDVDRVDDNADVQTDAKESEELLRHESLETETKIMLERVDAALARISDGGYGKTDEGEEIPFERLKIDPTVTTTVK